MAYGAVLGQKPDLSAYAKKEGLPVNDIRELTIRDGESISAGDVVNVGGSPETVYKDVVAQDNVETKISTYAVTNTDIIKLNQSYSVVGYTLQNNGGHCTLLSNEDNSIVTTIALNAGENISSVSLARLDDSHFVVVYAQGTSNLNWERWVLTGTTLSKEQNLGTLSNNMTSFDIVMTNTTQLFLAVAANLGGDLGSGLYARIGSTESGNPYSYHKVPNITGANYISACRLPDDSNGNKRVCICFSDTGDSNKGKAVIATIDSSNVVTFGDVVEIGGSTTTNSKIINCVANDTEIYMQFDTGLFVYDFSLISLSTRSGVSGTGNPYSGALALCAEHSVAFINSSRAYVFSFNGESLSRGDEFKYNDTSFVTTWYMSAASMDNNRVLLAYANPSNSNYGTTTILTVEGNQIAGSFIDNSQDAIALADGTGGQSIPVGFGGYCECLGVTEGQQITSDGVSAFSPLDGWLSITDARNKQVSVTGSFTATTSLKTINVGFKPSMVICYTSINNVNSVANSDSSSGNAEYIPRILTNAYNSTSDGCLIDTGFTFRGAQTGTVYYIAWR